MSWHFLRPGQSGPAALEAVEALMNGLGSIANPEPVLAADNYLRWVEGAELQLRSRFADSALWRGLHTERYWRIRAITPTTPAQRPAPLIGDEVEDQRIVLAGLRDQLTHYLGMLAPAVDERLLLLDTNTLVHGQIFDQVRWNEHIDERKARLVLPLVVLDELDTLKNRGIREAGAALRALDSALPHGRALAPTGLRDNVTLQLVDEPLAHERLGNSDDEIVHQAAYYASLSGDRITLLTMDRGMRVRAEAASIAAMILPESLHRSKEARDGR